MPRDGSGIYTLPFPDVVTLTTIESAKENGTLHDLATDANAARPIIAGGTGATSAAQARDQSHLQAERATQTIVNFDADPMEPGSFKFAASAVGNPPVSGHAFAGIIFGPDNNNLVVNAYDQSDTTVPGTTYTREKKAGVWGAWSTVLNTAATVAAMAVRYDAAQTLTPAQKQVALKNIGADQITTRGAGDYSLLATDRVVAIQNWTGPNTFTLPPIASVNVGEEILIYDDVAFVSATNTLTIAPSGTDWINDVNSPVVLRMPRCWIRLINDGGIRWTIVGCTGLFRFTQYLSGSGTHTTLRGATSMRVVGVGGGGGGVCGGTAATGAGNGGTTTFGPCTGTGGNVGGGASGGDVNVNGGNGTYPPVGPAPNAGGSGSPSPLGAGGTCAGAAHGSPGSGYGSGGAGGGTNTAGILAGQGGSAGGYFEKWFNGLALSYAYAVGAGGAGGTTTNMTNGGAGAPGYIGIWEWT